MIRYRNPYADTVLRETLTYRDFLADIVPNSTPGERVAKLPVRDWAPLIKSVKYQGRKDDVFKFYVESGLNGWFTYVRFVQFWDQVKDRSINAVEASRLLLWGSDLQFHCNCPSFSYHGFEYILTQHDAALVPENRFPDTNNPELLGTLCKHGRRTFKVLGFQLGRIAAAVKESRTGLDNTLTPPPDDF